MDRPGNRKYFASLLARVTRGDKRTRLECRLDDQHTFRETADQSIASRKILFPGGCPGRKFGEEPALVGNPVRKIAMARRIHAIKAGADDGERRPRAEERPFV